MEVKRLLCVIAKIDEAARDRLRAIQQIGDSHGVPTSSLYGHITLATYISGDEAEIIRSCKARLHGQRAFSVHYERIEVLPVSSIIIASPRRSGALLRLHRMLVSEYPAWLNEWTRTDQWKPHTTLLHDPLADLDAIAAQMRAAFHPFSAHVSQIEFSRVHECGYDIIGKIALNAS